MRITYKKLWKLLIDREMNKQDLKRECNISSASVAKLGKGENITTDVLNKLLIELPQAKSIAVMIQKEVGDKLLSGPGDEGYGPLAILCQFYYDVRRALDVPAACFTPPPKVDSSFMVLERRTEKLYAVADEALLMLVAAYLVILLPISIIFTQIERRLRYAGFGNQRTV